MLPYKALPMPRVASRSWYLWPVIIFAIETAMRRGETLGLQWEQIDLDQP
jgi:integrase